MAGGVAGGGRWGGGRVLCTGGGVGGRAPCDAAPSLTSLPADRHIGAEVSAERSCQPVSRSDPSRHLGTGQTASPPLALSPISKFKISQILNTL